MRGPGRPGPGPPGGRTPGGRTPGGRTPGGRRRGPGRWGRRPVAALRRVPYGDSRPGGRRRGPRPRSGAGAGAVPGASRVLCPGLPGALRAEPAPPRPSTVPRGFAPDPPGVRRFARIPGAVGAVPPCPSIVPRGFAPGPAASLASGAVGRPALPFHRSLGLRPGLGGRPWPRVRWGLPGPALPPFLGAPPRSPGAVGLPCPCLLFAGPRVETTASRPVRSGSTWAALR